MRTASLQERADRLATAIAQSPDGACWTVVGGLGFGKTALLRALQETLPRDLIPIKVAPPAEAMDSAGAALLQIGEGLQQAGRLDGELERLQDPARPWHAKLEEVARWLDHHKERVVLLCDEPNRWPIREENDALFGSYSNLQTRNISQWVQVGARCRRVITVSWVKPDRSENRYHLPNSDLPLKDLAFGPLDALSSSLTGVLGARLSRVSFLEMRLLVALAAVAGVEKAAQLQMTWPDSWALARSLRAALAGEPAWQPLLELMTRLALVRGAIGTDLLRRLGVEALAPPAQDVLLHGILQPEGDEYHLHPVLREVLGPESALSAAARVAAHRQIAGYYAQALAGGNGAVPNRLQLQFEGFHHAASSADRGAVEHFRVFFVDQLHTLGRALSKEHKDYLGAAEVFRSAVAYLDEDDYSHHYWAYNIDCAAADRELARREYQRAVELNPSHPWWWSRWINFLITLGRLPEAKQEWTRALSALGAGGGSGPDYIYEALHLWVARLLLHRSQLDFAQQVLDDTRPSVRAKHTGFRALDRLLAALKLARAGRGVFPANIDPRDYTPGPHLDFRREVEGKTLRQWHPARVDGVDEQFVYLVVGKHDPQTGQWTYGQIELPVERFNAASLDEPAAGLAEGRLLELAFYGDEGWLQIRTHPDTPYTDPDLPFFDPPDPGRYLKKGVSGG